jgi:hypothetical protein
MTKATFGVYFRASLETLILRAKDAQRRDGDESTSEAAETRAISAIHHARRLVGLFGDLVTCSKCQAVNTRFILHATIKGGDAFLRAFLAYMMPLMEKHFLLVKDRILELLPELQKVTRFLQRVCTQTKDVEKDAKLMPLVPKLKQTLESIVFRTKVRVWTVDRSLLHS